MRTNQFANEPERNGRAVIIGGGIAGLSAARVLAKFYDRVTIIDRDHLPDGPDFRSGIPQAHHAHTLLPYGQMVLDHLFPGFVDQLIKAGADTIDAETETVYYDQGIWRKPSPRASQPGISASRPMLESELYRRIQAIPQVTVLQGYEVVDLVTDASRERVTGLIIRGRKAPVGVEAKLQADLVVDASGRNSKAPEWLARLGFLPPEEWRIDAHAGYASRIYRQPEGYERGWKKLYIGPCPPDGLRGGVIIPIEGKRWHVTLIGLAGDFPPTEAQGFLEFARSLPVPDLYEAIQAAEPLSRITGYRNTINRVRRFDALPRYLEGLLVLGDAVFAMNPIYAAGMTAAALGSQVLEQVLRACGTARDGLAAAFQKTLASRTAVLWKQAVQSDWLWPETDIWDNTETL